MTDRPPSPALVDRFARDLDALVEPGAKLGIAVSGGPDSLALLLLAAAARPGHIEAATVDHRLRPEARIEAETVAAICAEIAVPHALLTAEWANAPKSNVQALAREARYGLLAGWAAERELGAVATAHHADDQAETLLMRLARGAGVGGLAGVQPSRRLTGDILLIRPLLGWRRDELAAIVAESGLDPVDDPTNADEHFDRTRARALLGQVPWLEAGRLAAVASNAADAEQALEWAAADAFAKRHRKEGAAMTLDPSGLPRELRRRLLLEGIAVLSGQDPPGPKLIAALDALEGGRTTTLAGLKLEPGPPWRLSPAPPRRR